MALLLCVVVESALAVLEAAVMPGNYQSMFSMSTFSALPGFTPRQLNISDAENAFPVPTERSDGDRFFLYLASGWLVFVSVVCALRSSWAARLALQWQERLLNGRTAAAAAAAD